MQRILSLTMILFFLGCGSTEPLGTANGKVTLDGQALTEGTITFENQERGIALSGQIKGDGTFVLSSHKGAGLVPGPYKVSVSPGGMLQSAEEIPLVGKNPLPPKSVERSPLPEKYRRSSTSGLTAEIKVGTNPPFVIDLKK